MARALQRLFLVAGEASSDGMAAGIMEALKRRFPDVEIYGVGGENLRRLGMDIRVGSSEVNMVGLTDWMGEWIQVLRRLLSIKQLIRKRPPDLALLMDLPDFNLMLAGQLKRMGVPVIYGNPPQVWAWRKYRIHKIRRRTDLLLVPFPFEKSFYDARGLPAVFTGHPLSLRVPWKEQVRTPRELAEAPRIAILPGSRRSELAFHGPVLAELITRLRRQYPDARILVPVASTLSPEQVGNALQLNPAELSQADTLAVMAEADAAVVCSGTATLEAALSGTPFTLFYRVSASSYFAGRTVFGYRSWMGLPNVLLEREAVREFVQNNFRADLLESEVVRLLENNEAREALRRDLAECRAKLAPQGSPAETAAEAVASFWSRRS